MARAQERKRKLEQEQSGRNTPKRSKTSRATNISQAKPATIETSDRDGVPNDNARRDTSSEQGNQPQGTAGSITESLGNSSKSRKSDQQKATMAVSTKASKSHANGVKGNAHDEESVDTTHQAQNESAWSLSLPSAGRFIHHDPIFVSGPDGSDCLIAANKQQVQLLSIESSLILQTYRVPEARTIVCFAHRSATSGIVDIALDDGTRLQWNWLTAEVKQGAFPGKESVKALVDSTNSLGQPCMWYIAGGAHRSSIVRDRSEVFASGTVLHSLRVVGDGQFVVAISDSGLVIGALRESSQDDPKYNWLQIRAPLPLTAVDARLVKPRGSTKIKGKPELDCAVAVGNSKGQIHLLASVASLFASSESASLQQARILHWHRESVSAVKFSVDGNYLISGGSETVLVLWQLQTGYQQYLPHLTSEIERITVSPNGALYALQMGSNSIMVLSTTELKPVANFPGLQYPVWIPTASNSKGLAIPRPTATLHPTHPETLFLSVPATQPLNSRSIASRPFLQIFDLKNSRHILRQALTRNNVTDLNIGPTKTPIVPPDVSQIAISSDGQWLATVDDWFPPASDLEHTISQTKDMSGLELAELEEQQNRRREVYLKFWHWDQEQGLWSLTTRVDSPHARFIGADAGDGAGQVLKLVSDPSTNGFATIGPDGCAKIWRPRIRSRYGATGDTGRDGNTREWVCRHATALPIPSGWIGEELATRELSSPQRIDGFEVEDACLAFSPDGSLLACAYGDKDGDPVDDIHFVSPSSGEVVTSKTGLVVPSSSLLDMGFVDRYFVTLSLDGIRVWNLIDDTHQYTVAFPSVDNPAYDDPLLAIDHDDDTFAVVSFGIGTGETAAKPLLNGEHSSIAIYSPRDTQPIYRTSVRARPTAVLSGKGSRGFTVLFDDSTIRTLTPPSRHRVILHGDTALETPVVAQEQSDSVALVSSLSHADEADDVEMEDSAAILSNGLINRNPEDDRQVVRPEQLAAIFEARQSFAMPSVRDMFQSVVSLYARKPYRDLASSNAMEVDAQA